MVHSGIRFRMRIGIDLRLSPGRMAIRSGRGNLGWSRGSTVVVEKEFRRTIASTKPSLVSLRAEG